MIIYKWVKVSLLKDLSCDSIVPLHTFYDVTNKSASVKLKCLQLNQISKGVQLLCASRDASHSWATDWLSHSCLSSFPLNQLSWQSCFFKSLRSTSDTSLSSSVKASSDKIFSLHYWFSAAKGRGQSSSVLNMTFKRIQTENCSFLYALFKDWNSHYLSLTKGLLF